MAPSDVLRELDDKTAAAVPALAADARQADGLDNIDPTRLQQALSGEAAGFMAAVEWDSDREHLTGYAQAVRSPDGAWDIERVASPARRGQRGRIAQDLVKATLGALADEDGAELRLWIYAATPIDDRLAGRLGLQRVRELRQLRIDLPLSDVVTIETRAFVVGQDEDAWLEVNNRAFAGHRDQSGWSREQLAPRLGAPWFDPTGFLLYEEGERLAGFCWTKVHADTDPPMGEIYVIGVDPDWQGRGFGRQLVLAGLAHLAGEDLRVGMLYVDADNESAVGLYDAMGFTIHHVDRVYSSTSPPS